MKIIELAKRNFSFIHHVSSSLILSLSNSLVFFFLTPSLLTNLGKERYGVWILLFSLISYFNISNLGVTTAFFYEFAKNKLDFKKSNILVNTTFFGLLLSLVIPLLVLIVVLVNFKSIFLVSSDILTEVQASLFILFFSFCFNYLGSVFDNIVFANKKISTRNLVDLGRIVLSGIVMIILNKLGYGLFYLAIVEVVFSSFRFLIMYKLAKGYFPFQINFSFFSYGVLKHNLKPGFFYFLGTVSAMLAFQTDSVLISTLLGAKYITGYAIMYKFVNISSSILGSFTNVKMPKLAEMIGNKNFKGVISMHNKLYLVTLGLLIPICLAIYFAGEMIINVWIKQKIDFNQDILNVFILFLIVNNLAMVSGKFNNALGVHRIPILFGVFESLVNIALSYLLYKYLGLIGIALGTLLSHLFMGGWFATFYFYKSCRKKMAVVYQ